jgi:hypothetical protein
LNWSIQELGSAGEFVSSLFMLVTLLYLAVQVTYLKRQARTQATFNRALAGRENLLAMANSDYLPQILRKMNENSGQEIASVSKLFAEKYGLERDETQRVTQYFFAWLKAQEANFGNISVEEQVSTDRTFRTFAQWPGFTDWWSFIDVRACFNDDFARHIDTLLGE